MYVFRSENERLIRRWILRILGVLRYSWNTQEYFYKDWKYIFPMANDYCQTKLREDVKKKLDELEFVKRRETYSKTIETLTSFYEENKELFEKWWKKRKKE